jgi:tryptophan synthase alpha chain
MSHLQRSLRDGGKLICYITAGYPDMASSIDHALACVRGGASALEIGVPFSDPVADGPVIQHTSHQALMAGTTPKMVFEMVRSLRTSTDVPIVLMGYYNPIFRMGERKFVSSAAEVGANGLIVPDLPCEESLGLRDECSTSSVDLIQLVGPTTSDDRMEQIARHSSGFLYLVSALGPTGVRGDLSPKASELVGRAKRVSGALPVGVGFGVSTAEQVKALHQAGSDAVILGSAILRRIIDGSTPTQTEEFVSSLLA